MTASEKTVLLAEDNEATCTLVTAILHKEFTVECAIDGHDALERLRTKRYAAVLLDLKMPVVDGFAVLDFLRDHSPDMLRRVLILTAALTPRELTRANSYPICGVVRKPFEVEALLEAVRQCAEQDDKGFSSLFTPTMLILLAGILRNRWLG
jgi:two-component system sensor histidine kinase/response regulator